MNRRSFLSSAGLILGAPAIVRAESLMKIWVPPERGLAARFGLRIDPAGRIEAFGLTLEDFETAQRLLRETVAIYEAFGIKDRRLLGSSS